MLKNKEKRAHQTQKTSKLSYLKSILHEAKVKKQIKGWQANSEKKAQIKTEANYSGCPKKRWTKEKNIDGKSCFKE